jgi:hypothetical protein
LTTAPSGAQSALIKRGQAIAERLCAQCHAIGPVGESPRRRRSLRIERLLDAVWAPDAVGRRNYAMLMMMARLGLRAHSRAHSCIA